MTGWEVQSWGVVDWSRVGYRVNGGLSEKRVQYGVGLGNLA